MDAAGVEGRAEARPGGVELPTHAWPLAALAREQNGHARARPGQVSDQCAVGLAALERGAGGLELGWISADEHGAVVELGPGRGQGQTERGQVDSVSAVRVGCVSAVRAVSVPGVS